MEDLNNPTQYMGEGHPHHHGVNHTRPYFYMQPPTQPYHRYMYQWNMNPYGQYGLPVSALPYMAPYPYMPGYCPGYMMPQAPIHPSADYRRMFNPHLSSSSACYDIHYRHHYSRIKREMASSEVQTDPNDPLNKLIGSLEGLRTNETSEKENKAPPPEVVTPYPSGMAKEEFNEPVAELKPLPQRQAPMNRRVSGEPQPILQPHPQPSLQPHPQPHPQSSLQPQPHPQPSLQPLPQPSLQPLPQPSLQPPPQPSLQPPPQAHPQPQPCLQHKLYTPLQSKPSGFHCPQQTSDSTIPELNNTASSQSCVGDVSWALMPGAQQGDSAQLDTWSLGSGIAVLPIDSSSLIEEDEENMEACCHERPCLASETAEGCDELEDVDMEHRPDPLLTESHGCGVKTQTWNLKRASAEHQALDAAHCLDHNLEHKQVQNLNHAGALELIHPDVEEELPYRILRLPCDKVTTSMLQQDHPLWFLDPTTASSLPPQSYLSLASSSSAYYYSYYPQAMIQGAAERQSVLAPSIDELSSRDELFSTDLDDDLVVGGHDLLSRGTIYIGGGKLAASVNYCSPDAPDDSGKENHAPEVATFSSEMCSKTCACCGTSLERKDGRRAFRGETGGNLACRYPERARGGEEGEAEEAQEEVQEEVEYVEEELEVFVSGSMMPGPGKRPQHYHYPSTRSQHQAGPPYHSYPPLPPLPPLHSKRRFGRMCECEDHGRGEEMGCYDDQQEQGCAWGSDYCPPAHRKADEYKEERQGNAPPRAYNGTPWRGGPVALDPDSWANGGATFMPRSWRPYSGTHGRVRPQHRRPSQQRPRRAENDDYEEGEVSHYHRGRGSTKRRGTRY